MTGLLMSLIAAVVQQARVDLIRKTQEPEAVQDRFLRSLLAMQQHTELGRDLGLSDIKTVDQFRERIPVQPYRFYEPYVERVARGEPQVMTVDPVTYLNLTSGSTGKQKLIPVTRRSRQAASKANRASMGFAFEATRQRGLSLGKMLLTSSTQVIGQTDSGILYGPVSVSHLRQQTNVFYRQLLAHPFEALQIADGLARHYVCLLFALQNPTLRVIGANFPVLALRLCDYLEQYAEDLILDLQTGEIAHWLTLEPELRNKLERLHSAQPKRADQLRSLLKTEGRLTPKLAWDGLSFIITARGGTSNFYLERFPVYFGDTPVFGGTYSSAESVYGVHHNFNTDAVILALESGFFEFIPEDQWEIEQPKTLLPMELKAGDRYRILVTNYSGFYRYDIGDVVEVEGFYNKTPLIVYRHRRGGQLSSTTEKTTEFHAIQVMQRLQQDFHLSVENFCITLSEPEIPAHYLVNIELSPGSTLDNPQEFLKQFDHCLKEIHTSYAVKRGDHQVPSPRLRILEPGSFSIIRQRLLGQGIFESHLKFPHVTENRRFLDGLRVLQEIRLSEE